MEDEVLDVIARGFALVAASAASFDAEEALSIAEQTWGFVRRGERTGVVPVPGTSENRGRELTEEELADRRAAASASREERKRRREEEKLAGMGGQ